jgi:glycosyltransferase involved in cell wall biosynthesis
MTIRVISLAHTIWSERWLNRQQLLSRIGREVPVVYSNGCWFTWDRHGGDWRRAGWRGGFKRIDNVWLDEVPRWLMRSPRLGHLDGASLAIQARRWRRQLARHGDGPLILHLFHPAFVDYVDAVSPDAVVYQPYDLLEAMPGWTPEQEAQERRLLARADEVIASSAPTVRRLAAKSGRPVKQVENGVDFAHFERARSLDVPEPQSLARIPHPRIGYVGSLHPVVDFGMFAAMAQRRPDWHFVLIGGQSPRFDERMARDLDACRKQPNVHFLGMQPLQDMPAYMLHMDVNTICWHVGEGSWGDAAYPLKLQEYLATGRPVISSALESVRAFSHVVRLADGVDDWEQAVIEVLAGQAPGNAEQRVAIASQNSWDSRAAELLKILKGAAGRVGA